MTGSEGTRNTAAVRARATPLVRVRYDAAFDWWHWDCRRCSGFGAILRREPDAWGRVVRYAVAHAEFTHRQPEQKAARLRLLGKSGAR